MNNEFIDARDKNCPIPLIMLRKALKERQEDSFGLIVNNKIAKDNIERFLKDNNIIYSLREDNKEYYFFINNSERDFYIRKTEDKADFLNSKEQKNSYVICIKSDTMGNGPEELGRILMRAYINTLTETTKLPDYIVFYNSGVLMACKNSGVTECLRQLIEHGVKIIICGACVDYFNIKDKIADGTISNMFEIADLLAVAEKVIYP